MTELISLLDEIAGNIDFHCAIIDGDEEFMRAKAEEYFMRFKEIYARIGRHKYSDVTKFIDSLLQDKVDSLRDGVSGIITCAEANEYDRDTEDPTNKECYVKISKLCDHIELEAARYSSIKKIQLMAETHSKQEEAVIDLLAEAENAVNEAHEQAKHLSQQLISILGIFAGIIVTFSFATAIGGEAIVNIAKGDVIYLGFVICSLGTVFMNIIAFMLSFVTKLSGHKFSKTFPWLIYVLGTFIMVGLSLLFYFQYIKYL